MNPRALLAEARRVDSVIRSLVTRRSALMAELVAHVRDVAARGLFLALGFASVAAYTGTTLGWSGEKTRSVLELGERLRKLPVLKAAFEAGEVLWSRARVAARVAEARPGEEAVWVERAKTESVEALERAAAEVLGEEVTVRRGLTLSLEQLAWVEDAVRAYRETRPGESVGLGEAVAEICRRFLSGESAGTGTRVGLTVCEECGRGTRETSVGTVEVSAARVEEALCDTTVVHRNGAVKRTIPRRVAAQVRARDRDRCSVPSCGNRGWLENHHEGGYQKVGHSVDDISLMCHGHHRARHRGALVIEGRGAERVFRLADGTVLQ